ncbi:MAG: Na(+)-translocating NADH-quinone reductase subunit A [Crocinitomicaceae bacterium]|nr:Na(+)-translocating NADH-quinone reductase subunit A [Crocinitomicaceae bacterium]
MSKTVKLKKGLNIKLVGEAEKVSAEFVLPSSISVRPSDFHGLTPKMVVKAGDTVLAGDTLFFNKYKEKVKCVTPISGVVRDVIRGEKRSILEVIVDSDGSQKYKTSNQINLASVSREDLKEHMLNNGLWMFIKQRPIDIVADPETTPKAIFVSAFDSSPLAADLDFMLQGESDNFQAGLDALSKLTDGTVHLTLNCDSRSDEVFSNSKNVQINKISGKHPVGNVGTQIHHIDPINKGELVWTVNAQDVMIIGRCLLSGKFDTSKMIAFTGSEAKNRKYFKTLACASIAEIVKKNIEGDNVRIVSGNPLTGERISEDGYLGFYANQITVLPEGNEYKFFLTKGWLGPGFDKYSYSRLFPTFLSPNKRKRLDTNTNGEERGFVVTGEMEKVFPFDILPMQLVKAAITDDIDGMENLGIYEVIPEDFALCEYVCSSKINIQDKIRTALDLIQDECM